VEVQVQVERRAEALNEGDGAALLGAHAPVSPNASPQLSEERAQEGAEHFARELAIVRAAVAKRVRKCEHPLADRHRGEHAVDEVRRGVGHAATATRRAEAAALARERHEAVVATVVAVQAQEAVGEDAAAQEGADLLLDEVRRRPLAGSRPSQERLELLAHDAVQECLLRRARCVISPRAVAVARTGRPALQHPTAEMRRACRVRARGESAPDGPRAQAFTSREARRSLSGATSMTQV
jgi:hypothetical protein